MANVKVTFDRIEVDDDGDPGVTDGKGDFHYRFSVNGSQVTARSSANPLAVGNGGVINLNASRSVELRPDQDLVVSGYLADKDQGTSGADEIDDFSHTYDQSENWGDGDHDVALVDKRMNCTLHYNVTAG
ncbi:MAG TPA: hypothetical protein VFI47_04470 [Acidimicrobiales bacterium]|nr:hypothetical protein [Acidimicrobiales bacterium]